MRQPTRLEVVAILERRIADFVESVTGEPMRPKMSLLPGMLEAQRLGKIIVDRLLRQKFLKEHLRDDHDSVACGLCREIADRCGYGLEAKVSQFLEMNRELLAALRLTS